MSGFVNPASPNITDYTTFVYGTPQAPTGLPIPTSALPTNSPYLGYSFNVAMDIVYPLMGCISALLYCLAVYNLGLDRLINFCPDQVGQTYFATLRAGAPNGYGIYSFVPGVVTAASDESTASTITAPDFMKNLTLSNLQNLKTPFGIQYLSIMQDTGTLWGVS
jgi:hypothetical protein